MLGENFSMKDRYVLGLLWSNYLPFRYEMNQHNSQAVYNEFCRNLEPEQLNEIVLGCELGLYITGGVTPHAW